MIWRIPFLSLYILFMKWSTWSYNNNIIILTTEHTFDAKDSWPTWPDVNKCMYLQRILLNMFRQYKCILSFYPGRCQTNLGSCLSNDTLFQISMRLVLSLYTPILRNIIKLYLIIKFISKTSVRYPYLKTRLHNCLMERLWVKWTDQ